MTQKQQSGGFVALFFVLTVAAAMGFLMSSLVLKSKNMFRLLDDLRNTETSRFATNYCLQKLIYNKRMNMGYKPSIGNPIEVSRGVWCSYASFTEESVVGVEGQQSYVRVDSKLQMVQALRKFAVRIQSTHTVPGYVHSGYVSAEYVHSSISSEIYREFLITDFL